MTEQATPPAPLTLSASLSVRLNLDAGDTKQGLSLDVAFDVPPGVTVLFGPSGAGKSRTLACIAGLVRPHRGRVTLGERVWFDAVKGEHLAIHERRVAYVFQALALFPHMTALDNVGYGISRGIPKGKRHAIAEEMLGKMQVPHLAHRKPRTFSGGEAQRVALARAFAMRPSAVLLDEPFSALDATVKAELLRVVADQLAREKVPTILVTHQPEDAELLGDRVVSLEKGRVTRATTMHEDPFGRAVPGAQSSRARDEA